MFLLSKPTLSNFSQGFARSAAESENPGLWDGLVALWAPYLGPTGLTLFDRGGRQNHGTLTNMDPATDWVPTDKGWALGFDGVNDHVLFSHRASIDFADESMAIWFTFRTPGGTDIYRLCSKNYGGAGVKWWAVSLLGDVAGNGEIRGAWDDGATNSTVTTIGQYADNAWHDVLAVRDADANKLRLYVDGGTEVAEAVDNSGSVANSGDLVCGGRADLDPERFFKGEIVSFLLYRGWVPTSLASTLHTDPHALLRPRRLIYPAAAAEAPSGAIAGSSSVAFSANAELGGGGQLAGITPAEFLATGVLGGRGNFTGASSAAFDATATARAIGELRAAAALAFGSNGIGSGLGELVGTSAMVFGATLATTRVGKVAGTISTGARFLGAPNEMAAYGSDGAATEGTYGCQRATI